MQPIDNSPIARSRPVGTDAARTPTSAPATPGSAVSPPAEPGVIAPAAIAKAVSAGAAPPVDKERVAQIRTAVREGSYPLVPAKVADALIAANYLLIEGKKD